MGKVPSHQYFPILDMCSTQLTNDAQTFKPFFFFLSLENLQVVTRHRSRTIWFVFVQRYAQFFLISQTPIFINIEQLRVALERSSS